MSPRVSVVIPVYNREALIARAIDSVLAQRGCDFELIVVNDGSTDGTRELLDGYGQDIRAIHQQNAGRSAARNAGMEAAEGEFVALLDSDDTWHENKLEAQLAFHEAQPELGLSAHGIEVAHEDGRVEAKPPKVDIQALKDRPYETLMDHFAFFPSVMMVKRSLSSEIGHFSCDYHGAEDLDFALKIARRAPVSVFPDCLTRMYQHGGQTSRKQLAKENVRVLRKHLELFGEDFDAAMKAKLTKKIARYMISVAKRVEDSGERLDLLKQALSLDSGLRWKPSYWRLRWRS